jgi:hypothetical protein
MKELMYDLPAGLLALGLLIATFGAVELGYRVGVRRQGRTDEPSRAHIHQTETSTLGLLALLLAFAFSTSLQRYDTRSEHVVDEANAIGTAWLRTDLLPAPVRDDVRRLMVRYVDRQVRASRVATSEDDWRDAVAEAGELQAALWSLGMRAAELDPSPVRSGLFIQALNDMFDSFGRRDAGLERHVPEPVLLLLFGVFLVAAAIVGFASGTAGHRPPAVSLVMVAMIILLIYLILDLDRPRRGLIEVPKQSLYDVQASIQKAMRPAAAPSGPSRAAAAASGASR